MALAGCTVVPGMYMNPYRERSSVELPVDSGDKTAIEQVGIRTITAELIIELEKDINNRSLGADNAANNYYTYRIGSTAEKAPEPKSYYQYIVGPRDILTITVWEHPELTIPAGEFRSAESAGTVVGEDGTIFYPYAGVVQAAGRTVEQIRADLTKRLSRYIENVQLDARVAAYRSQRVYVVGEVNNPGIQLVRDIPLTVLEAINNASGFTEEADRRNLILTRNNKTYQINLLALYEGGDTTQNVLLQHGDVLNAPDRRFNKVFVLGEVSTPGSLFMNKGRMTLNEAIGDVGGVNEDSSDAAQIFVFRGGIGKPSIYHLNAQSPDALLLADRFPLQPRDVIYVDAAQGIRWNRVIAQIQPTVTLLNSFDGLNIPPNIGSQP